MNKQSIAQKYENVRYGVFVEGRGYVRSSVYTNPVFSDNVSSAQSYSDMGAAEELLERVKHKYSGAVLTAYKTVTTVSIISTIPKAVRYQRELAEYLAMKAAYDLLSPADIERVAVVKWRKFKKLENLLQSVHLI